MAAWNTTGRSRPTTLWTNRFSIDRVNAPGNRNNYPTLNDVGLPSVLAATDSTVCPTSTSTAASCRSTPSAALTRLRHTSLQLFFCLQWVKGAHSIKFGGEQRIFFNNFWQPNYPTGTFDFSRDVTTQQPMQVLGDGARLPPREIRSRPC